MKARHLAFAALGLAIVAGLAVGLWKAEQRRRWNVTTSENFEAGRRISIALIFHAADIGRKEGAGSYPAELRDLLPEYEKLRFREASTGKVFDWLYFKPDENAPKDWIILASPLAGQPRIAFFVSGDGALLPEAEFQQRLARQQAAAK